MFPDYVPGIRSGSWIYRGQYLHCLMLLALLWTSGREHNARFTRRYRGAVRAWRVGRAFSIFYDTPTRTARVEWCSDTGAYGPYYSVCSVYTRCVRRYKLADIITGCISVPRAIRQPAGIWTRVYMVRAFIGKYVRINDSRVVIHAYARLSHLPRAFFFPRRIQYLRIQFNFHPPP